MGKIKNIFTDDGNLKAITLGLMAGTSLTALISVAALIELKWNGTRAIADFFGFEDVKPNVAVGLALASMSAVLFWVGCHRDEHKRLMRLIELQNEKIGCYSQYIDKLTFALLTASEQRVETIKDESSGK